MGHVAPKGHFMVDSLSFIIIGVLKSPEVVLVLLTLSLKASTLGLEPIFNSIFP